MKDLKFRVWYRDKMYYPSDQDSDKALEFYINIDGECTNNYSSDICLAMQYIGMKDHDGVEIFEGDIIEIMRFDSSLEPYMTFTIEDMCQFLLLCGAYQLDSGDSRLKVLGNIYEKEQSK